MKLGIEPPKGVLLFGPPGTGKTLCARAVANRTDACFIRVIGSELVQKYVGEGARMVRELFEMARSKKACLIFFDEIDAIGGARFDDGAGGDNEVNMRVTLWVLKTFNPVYLFSLYCYVYFFSSSPMTIFVLFVFINILHFSSFPAQIIVICKCMFCQFYHL